MDRRRIGLPVALAASAWAGTVLAANGDERVIPPGREQVVAELVRDAIGHGDSSISIERDRFRVRGPEPWAPQWVVFAPGDPPRGGSGAALAPGVLVQCGEPDPGPCPREQTAALTEVAHRLARGRDEAADRIWVADPPPTTSTVEAGPDAPGVPPTRGMTEIVDRTVALLAASSGLWLAVAAWRRREPDARRRALRWMLALLGVVAVFVALAWTVPPMVPMHEHNSFVVRSDCAIDPRCVRDPQAAWGMTTFHVYGWLLARVPYRLPWLSVMSLVMSAVALVLAFGVARGLVRRLGRPALANWGGLTSALVLALHPVWWRLAVAATFWPWALTCTFAAALAALHAAEAPTRRSARVAWTCAACWLLMACGGNLVLLTLGPLVVGAPLAWRERDGDRRPSVGFALSIVVLWATAAAPDYLAGARWAFGPEGLHADPPSALEVVRKFRLLLLDPRVSPWPWIVLPGLAAPWLLVAGGPRVLAPLLYAWLVPAAFLGLAAGDILGSGYPVGFINHAWELAMTAVLAGLGTAWAIGALQRRRPSLAAHWPRLTIGAVVAGGWIGYASMPEGWRLVTERRVVDRELSFISTTLDELPPHDVLVIPPDTLEPHDGLPHEGDPIEVWFPLGEYRWVMAQRGLPRAHVVPLDRFDDRPRPDRTLVYVGTSLRSFQAHEIRAGAVRESLQRDPLIALRDRYELEPVAVTALPTAQHEAVTMRLGADRVDTIEVGFYWLRPRSLGSSR